MQARISSEVFAISPPYCRVVIEAFTPTIAKTLASLADEMMSARCDLNKHYADSEALLLDPRVSLWRDAAKEGGWSASKYRSSLEALARRALKDQLTPLGITLIDLGTVATLRHLLPVGVHVTNGLGNTLELRPALGDETFESLDGAIDRPIPGEIVYVADRTVLTRRWVWRQGTVGSIHEGQSDVQLAINLDFIDASLYDVDKTIRDVAGLFRNNGVQIGDVHILDISNPKTALSEDRWWD